MKQCPKCKTRHVNHARYCMYDGVMLEGSPGGISLVGKFRSIGWGTRILLVLVLLLLGSNNLERVQDLLNHAVGQVTSSPQNKVATPAEKDIPFTIRNVKTFGDPGESWAECQVILYTDTLPGKKSLGEISLDTWRAEGKFFNEIAIEFYLDGMSTGGIPYAEYVVRSGKIHSLEFFLESLEDTVWEGEKIPGS